MDCAFDHEHVLELLRRNALVQETMRKEDVFRIREELEKAEARKLQPCFVGSFFIKVFEQAGGALYPLMNLADELIQHLSLDPDAEISIRVEIQANFPHGVDDGLKRTVNENARHLKLSRVSNQI